jgi:hypothetical protein
MDVEKHEPEPNSDAIAIAKAFKPPSRLVLAFLVYCMVGSLSATAWMAYHPARIFEIVPPMVAAFYLLILLAVWSRRSQLLKS